MRRLGGIRNRKNMFNALPPGWSEVDVWDGDRRFLYRLFQPQPGGGCREERIVRELAADEPWPPLPPQPPPKPTPRTTDVGALLKLPPMERNSAENELIRVAVLEAAEAWDRSTRR